MSAVIEKENVYRAISGDEAIDLILDRFRDELVNSGMFPLHRTWHEFEFVGGVRVKGWSTKTEEVKFSVGEPISEVAPVPEAERIETRVDVKLAPAPPSLLRESLPDIPCPNNCGHTPFHSKESLKGHLNRWCKAPAVMVNPDESIAVATNEDGDTLLRSADVMNVTIEVDDPSKITEAKISEIKIG